jgi:hypothetical protein
MKVKLFMCLIKGYALGSIWKWVISSTPRPFYPRYPGALEKRDVYIYLLSLTGIKLQLLGRPAHSLVTTLTELSIKIIFILLNEYDIIAQSVHRRSTGPYGRVRFPVEERDFSLLHSVHTGPEACPASYPMGTGALFPRGWSLPLTSI